MVLQRIVSRFPRRSWISSQPQRLCRPNCNTSVKFSDQSPKPLSQIAQKRDFFSGVSENYQGPTRVLHIAMPRLLGNLCMKLGFSQQNPLLASLKITNSIHSAGPKEFERGVDNGPVNTQKNSEFFERSNQRFDDSNRGQPPIEPGRRTGFYESLTKRFADMDGTRAPIEPGRNTRFHESSTKRFADMDGTRAPVEPGRNTGLYESLTKRFADMDGNRAPTETGPDGRPFMRGLDSFESGRNMNFVRGIMKDNGNYRSGVEQNADIVHIKILRNNTFVTVTDSKGNKKMGASAGLLAEMKGGPKVSKYSAEATAEHVGRLAKSMGLKSVVIKVNGFTFFKKKKLAILSFRDGYTNSRSDRNPIVYLEDTTRKAHNGCRLKKQRRV